LRPKHERANGPLQPIGRKRLAREAGAFDLVHESYQFGISRKSTGASYPLSAEAGQTAIFSRGKYLRGTMDGLLCQAKTFGGIRDHPWCGAGLQHALRGPIPAFMGLLQPGAVSQLSPAHEFPRFFLKGQGPHAMRWRQGGKGGLSRHQKRLSIQGPRWGPGPRTKNERNGPPPFRRNRPNSSEARSERQAGGATTAMKKVFFLEAAILKKGTIRRVMLFRGRPRYGDFMGFPREGDEGRIFYNRRS